MPGALARIALLDRQLPALDPPIGELMAPWAPASLAESGTERRHVGAAARLASWTGVGPGHDESAGQRRSGRTRPGNRARRRVLGPCAWAARKPPPFLGPTCRRRAGRRGGMTAAMAVAHQSGVIGYHRLGEGTC